MRSFLCCDTDVTRLLERALESASPLSDDVLSPTLPDCDASLLSSESAVRPSGDDIREPLSPFNGPPRPHSSTMESSIVDHERVFAIPNGCKRLRATSCNTAGAASHMDDNPAPMPTLPPSSRKLRERERKKKRRGESRRAAREDALTRTAAVPPAKYVLGAQLLKSLQDVSYLRIARGAYTGKRVQDRRALRTVAELLQDGFTYCAWDGKTPHILLDVHGRVLAILAGHPDDASWASVAAEASAAMEAARVQCNLNDGEAHRRGKFATLSRGVSFGGGQTAPAFMRNGDTDAAALTNLCGNWAIQRIAGFGSSVLASYAPRVYKRMQDTLGALYKSDPSLTRNFSNSIYPAATFNFGPQTACYPHTDAANDPCNYCQITALGGYNPKTSAQFIMYDSEVIIEFPPGATIFALSGLERHGNAPLQPGETRQSFTQYCAGGLLRWVDAGFRTLGTFGKEDPAGKNMFDRQADERKLAFISLLSTHDGLIALASPGSAPA